MSTQATIGTISEVHKDEETNKPEGGWGWIVVISATAICAIVDGYSYSTNQFYEQFLLEYKASPSLTTAYSSVMQSVIFIICKLSLFLSFLKYFCLF